MTAPAQSWPRPGLGVLLILAMTVCFASMDSLIRKLGGLLPVLLLLTTRYAFQALAMALWLAFSRRHRLRSAHPRFQALRGSLLLGITGHLLLILALGMAPAATLMPFTYVQIGLAAGLGWLMFNQLPDFWAWVGIAIVTVCGAGSVWLNLRSAGAAARKADAPVTADTLAD